MNLNRATPCADECGATRSGRSILVVDDDAGARDLITRILSEALPDITIASSGTGAGGLEAAVANQPEIIVLDVFLPDTTGVEVCRRLRADDATRRIPILMVTGHVTGHHHKLAGLDAGADAYVFKPFQPDEFIAQVKVMLRIKQSEDRLREQKATLEEAFRLQTLELAEKKSALEDKVGLLEEQLAAKTRELIREDNLRSDRLLATGMAHEINNPNTFIASNLATFRKFWDLLDKVLETHAYASDEERQQVQFIRAEMPGLLGGIQSGMERISRIIWRMKGMASDILADARIVTADGIIDAACELTRPQMAAGVTLTKSVSEGIPKLYGSEDLLVQAMANLLLNAAHAIEDSGKAGTITVRVFPDDQSGVQIEVSDTGTGIKPHDLDKVFSPFFTTRRRQGGTGLGLFFTHGVVKGHRGTLLVRSCVGEGTTFVVRLPARNERLPADAGGREVGQAVGASFGISGEGTAGKGGMGA